jgi:predicted RNA binding protein YcfA (HicA-like mRNA interferase family)
MKPLPFREVKRKLEAAGFTEAGQTGSHLKFAKTIEGRYAHSDGA